MSGGSPLYASIPATRTSLTVALSRARVGVEGRLRDVAAKLIVLAAREVVAMWTRDTARALQREARTARADRGSSAVEYALIVAAIAAVTVVGVVALGQVVSSSYDQSCRGIASATSATGCTIDPSPSVPASSDPAPAPAGS